MTLYHIHKIATLLTVVLTMALAIPDSIASTSYTPKVVNTLSEAWRWKEFPELEGKGIRYISQTSDDKVWIGYNEGIYEYDGYTWTSHNIAPQSDPIPVDQVLAANDGTIYGTTQQGIYKYDGSTWEHFFKSPEGIDFTFHQLKQLQDNSIIACSDWGIIHFRNDSDIQFYSSPSKISKLASSHLSGIDWVTLPTSFLSDTGDFINASDVLESKEGEVWFALTTEIEVGKLLKFRWADTRDKKLDNYEVISSTKDFLLGEDQKLLQSNDGKIWVINSSSNKAIHVYDKSNWKSVYMSKLFDCDDYMTDIVQTANGTIWISSMAKIFAYADNNWSVYRAPAYPIPANRVMIQSGNKDQLWVAGYKSKILHLDMSTDQWLTYGDLSFQCEPNPDEQWFLEKNNKVVRKKGSTWTSYDQSHGVPDSPIRMIYTRKGQLWVAGSHQGVAATALYKNGVWERHLHPKLSWSIDYRAVKETKDGSLWFGASVDAEKADGFESGVLHLKDPTADKLEWRHHHAELNGLIQENCYGIGQSPDGRIWIGGQNLLFFDGNRWHTHKDKRLQQYVNVVTSTDKLLLVGSRYYGIFIYDGTTWTNHTTDNGLSGNNIISIDAVSDSVIIAATESGICKYDGKSWTSDVFPEKLNMHFEGGSIHHSNQFVWINHVPRSWKRRVYQNSREGADDNSFFSTRYRPSHKPPQTLPDFHLERVSSEGNCIISWSGQDYFANTPADNLMYSYRMNGGDWSEFSTKKQHTFTSLDNGDYLLEVRARDLDFNVDPTPLKISFEVLAPIWKQAWFLALILAFLATFGLYEYRVYRKKRKLEIVNNSLSEANEKLKERGRLIEAQNQENLSQKKQIEEQALILEESNKDLAARNAEVRSQKDQLEEMLIQIENLSKAKLGFFTNISHEFRTPITLILGPISELIKNNHSISLEKKLDYYSIINKNAKRLLKLINQLLEIGRIEHSTLELNMSNTLLSEYVSEIVSLFDGISYHKDIHLEFTSKTDDLVASIDSDKVEKIMVNLLSNAFKHTPEGGSIVVELDRVSSHEHQLDTFYDSYFRLTVEDTGLGISADKIEFIFDKYFSTKSKISDMSQSGIGLSYTKDLIYLMQGELRVTSEENVGTKFTIFLPYISEKDISSKDVFLKKPSLRIAQQEASSLLNNFKIHDRQMSDGESKVSALPHILLVDDNNDLLSFMKKFLEEKYRVTTAMNGAEGLKKARQQSFDLIVSDIVMPEMDGITFCEKLREDLATSHIPLVLITANAMGDSSKISGYTKGADDFIEKPFNPELMLVRIDNLLSQREKLRESFNKEMILTPKKEELKSADEIFLSKLIALIDENLSQAEFNVDSMCKYMHLSRMHFTRKVKQLTGKKPIDLLKSFRMLKAKDFLSQNKLTIAEVAYKVGYDLPNSFSRAFKKEFHVTPSEFIKNIEQENISATNN